MTGGSAASVVGRVAGLMAIVVLQTYWFVQPVPLTLKALAAVIAALSLARPSLGLLIFAGLAPLSTTIAALCGAFGMGAQLIETMVLGIVAGGLLRAGPAAGRTRIGPPALFMAVVAVASAVAMLPAAAAPIARGLGDAGPLLQQLAHRTEALNSQLWAPLFAALTVVECGLLGWSAEREVRRTPDLAAQLVLMALIGHAGTAILSLLQIVASAMRTGDAFHEVPRLLLDLRLNAETDVHAGASALLLAGAAGLGLLSGRWPRRLGVGLLILLVALGIWITGSRVALALGIVTAVGWFAWRTVSAGRHRILVACLGIGIIAAGVWAAALYPNRYFPASRSASSRLVLMNIAVQLFKEAPVFGIGINQFYGASEAVGGSELANQVGYPRENAHNNFLQVLAEQGLVGFGGLLWWLGVVLLAGVRPQLANPTALRGSLLAAIAVCIGTWMTGHPLLVPEFAFVFWLYCGVLAAMTPAVPPARLRWLPWALAAAVVASVPFRASAVRNETGLEHMGFGLSMWKHDDSQRYREVGTSFALFLPSTGQPVEVPLRRAPGAPDPLVVDISIQGRLINRVSLEGDAWQTTLAVVRRGPRRFELVDFVVHAPQTSADAPPVLLRVGKDLPR